MCMRLMTALLTVIVFAMLFRCTNIPHDVQGWESDYCRTAVLPYLYLLLSSAAFLHLHPFSSAAYYVIGYLECLLLFY